MTQTRTRQRSGQQQRRGPGWDGPTPAPSTWALLPLRLFLGVTFTYAGLQKLANPDYLNAKSPTSVQATILSLQHQSPIGWMLSISSHAPVLVGVMIALGELSVGLATLVGLWVRLAALGGLLLALTFFLTVSFHTRPYYYGSDIVFVFAWTVPLIAGRWSGWTVDDWIRQRASYDADPQRRALVLGGVGAGALAAFAGSAAALTAVVGRALHPSSHPTSAPPPATPKASPKHVTQSPSGPSLPGRHLANASDIPVGRAAQFSDDQGNPAWLVHESDGSFRAFSAICTHAGCPVSFQGQEFICPCHGGSYSTTTGAVLGGPPPSALPQLHVQVVNGDVRLL